MTKKSSKKKSKQSQNTRHELLQYIIDTVNELSIKDRKTVMKIIAIDIGIVNITNGADGCRMLIDDISQDTLDSVLEYMAIALDSM